MKVAALESQPTLAADRFRVRYFSSRPNRGLAAGPLLAKMRSPNPAKDHVSCINMSDAQKSKLAKFEPKFKPKFKPWALRVIRNQLEKRRKRKHWTFPRWRKHIVRRYVRRQKKLRPKLMEFRLRQQAEERHSEACRQRMIALNAKRRAAKAAAQGREIQEPPIPTSPIPSGRA